MRPFPIENKGGVLLLRVVGTALNDGMGTGLRQGLYELLAHTSAPRVALDLAQVDFIASTGIALLIGTKRRVEADQGRVILFGIHPDILELFDNMKLTSLFEIAISEAEALDLFTNPPTS